jgi:MoxR-like ATPase
MVARPFSTDLGACSIPELGRRLAEHRYYADEGLLTAIHLALVLGRPLALEGEPGVGKTQVGKVLADALGRELIRLQCYEGLDASQALYEWDHPKQLLHVRVAEAQGRDVGDLYDERFLLERPLLRAVRAAEGAVLLIDEIDRSDSEFEAFLLEFLSEFQITIPELGTLRAARPPIVVLTSNRTRELHDALKRRCLYHWIAFPDAERERAILRAHAPGLDDAAAAALVEAIKRVRTEQLLKRPGVAETIDWALGARTLVEEGTAWPEALRRSLGLLLKEQEDVERVARRPELFDVALRA